MNSITFKKNDVTKNSYEDWGLIPSEEVKKTGNVGVLKFVLPYGDVPAEMRIGEIAEFFGDEEIVSLIPDTATEETKAKWTISHDGKVNSIGALVSLSYKTRENSKWKKNVVEEDPEIEE